MTQERHEYEVMSQLYEKERKMQSEQVNDLAEALAKAQGSMRGAKKSADNPFFKSKYADLSEVWEACREALSSNGLSVTQTTNILDGQMVMETTLLHSSGQWLKGVYPIKPTKDDPQGMGSAITYCRRYSLAAMVGVAQEDDDGNAASAQPINPAPRRANLYPSTPAWESAKAAYKRDGNLTAVLKRVDISDENQLKLIAEVDNDIS